MADDDERHWSEKTIRRVLRSEINSRNYHGPERRGNDMKLIAVWIGISISMGSALVGYGALGNDVEKQGKTIEKLEDQNVTREVLKLTLEPIVDKIEAAQQTADDNAEALERVEKTNWQILQELKAIRGGGDAHSHTR